MLAENVVVRAQTNRAQRFVRIDDVKDISPDSAYVISAILPMDKKVYALSGMIKSEKSAAFLLSNVTAQSLEIFDADLSCQWIIKKSAKGNYALLSASEGKYLYAKKPKQTGLSYSESEKFQWQIISENGSFRLKNAEEASRSIGLWSDGEKTVFGNYANADAADLLIFKKTFSGEKNKDIDWPEDGKRVFLGSKGFLLGKDTKAYSLNGFLLHDGTIASDADLLRLQCERGEDSCFVIKATDGSYLSSDFSLQPQPVWWRVVDGRLSVKDHEDKAVVCRDNRFSFEPIAQVDAENVVRLYAAADDATIQTQGNMMTLKGGWSGKRLSALPWQVSELDLSEISLPLHLETLASRPKEENTIIYVSGSQVTQIPSSWPFVVKKDDGENELVTPALLYDKKPFHCSRSFFVPEGLLQYQRNLYGDGGWETIYLPFQAELPEDIQTAKFVSVNDGQLTFEPANKIFSNTPMIIRGEKTASLALKSSAGVIESNEEDEESGLFCGSFDTLRVSSMSENIFLMDAKGQTFKYADAGSYLCPFRAYLKLQNSKSVYGINYVEETTAIKQLEGCNAESQKCFTIDGREILGSLSSNKKHKTTRGVYIVGRRKVFF